MQNVRTQKEATLASVYLEMELFVLVGTAVCGWVSNEVRQSKGKQHSYTQATV